MSQKIGRVIGFILADLLRAWVLMLCLGAIHSRYTEVPAISYWIAFLVVMAVDQLHKVDLDK